MKTLAYFVIAFVNDGADHWIWRSLSPPTAREGKRFVHAREIGVVNR
jgi:hypothetical protein